MVMKCAKCNVSVMDKPLTRVNPKDKIGIFWCWACLKQHEPELYKNEKEDADEVLKILIDEIYDGKIKI